MKGDKFQIIVIESELGEIKTYHLSRKKIKALAAFLLVLFTFVTYTAFHSTVSLKRVASENRELKGQVAELSSTKKRLSLEVAKLKEERDKTVKELAKRIKIIDSIMKTAGLKTPVSLPSSSESGEGGIYIPLENMSPEELSDSISVIDSLISDFRKYPFGIPAYGRLTSKFGIRRDPFTHLLAFHPGIDIANKPGTPVRVTADGKVIRAGWWAGWGKVVLVKHPSGYITIYAHLRKIFVKPGQKVKLGQVIGEMGDTGRSTGPHLHYGIEINDRWVNPMKFLEVSNVWKKR
ncbi:M23 family metallopeptidase [Desulfurobacterium sp.]|uniref:M23 family metallopeptidase n=1 Tax=Desulfurobacterium sp. TaxID=2004706 RepID=UPI00263709EC|nr:M23 family metallopeptidase [Desulfurobacterium sp.]